MFQTNELFGKMLSHIIERYKSRKKFCIVNVGGSRSGKTFDTAFLLMYLADRYKIAVMKNKEGLYDNILSVDGRERLIIDVYRNELKKARKTYEDFLTCIGIMGIGDKVRTSAVGSDRPSITFPNGNIITFYGLPEDGKSVEGSKSHICYFNEALEVPSYKVISNIVMRAEMGVIYDANPRETTHWLFDLGENDKDCLYTHTTYKDNKYLPKSLVEGIEQLCPWDLEDYVKDKESGKWYWRVKEEDRRENEVNIKKKTASKRDWLIYGEGRRCAREGAAFDKVHWIARIPDDIEVDAVVWGLDFGYRVHESALSRTILSGDSLYSECLLYKSYDNPEALYGALEVILKREEEWLKGISEFPEERPPMYIVCESQDNFEGTHFVSMIRNQAIWRGHDNWDFGKVKKRPRYKQDLIANINRFKFHVVESDVTKTELLNYVFKEVAGEMTTILQGTKGRNDHDHYIDSLLYSVWLMARHVK